jgi:alpha-beta hydrolase superfamily lysophospholipase
MKREEQLVGGVFGYRFPGAEPDHALVVCHGLGGHGGIYDVFGEQYANTGAEVWTLDLPGCGRSASTRRRGSFTVEEWVAATTAYTEHVRQLLDVPVVVMGSSLGVLPASAALTSCDAIDAAVLMGSGVAGLLTPESPFRSADGQAILDLIGEKATVKIDRLVNFDVDYGYPGAEEEKRRDPLNTWEFDLASWASIQTYEPEVPAAKNTKPVMFAVGENDPLSPPERVRSAAEQVGGPVEVFVQPNGVHQLMLFHTADFVAAIREFVARTVLKAT